MNSVGWMVAALALPLVGRATVSVYPEYMDPRRHPDEIRRSVKPPDRAFFGNRLQFTSVRRLKDTPDWKAELDRYVHTHNLGKVLWLHLGCLRSPNLDGLIRYVNENGLYLFDVWGYLPGQRAQGVDGLWTMPEGVAEKLERQLGPRWLGMDNGEQDGRWSGSIAPTHDRVAQYASFQRYFEHMDKVLGNRMAALTSLNYGHYFLKENCYTMLGAETAQALPNSQVYYAFIRGAGKQYGVPWFGNVSIYNRWGWKSYSDKPVAPNRDNGPTRGSSLALMKKLLYNQICYNGLVNGFEGSYFVGGFNGEGKLSPIGEIQKDAAAWVERYGDPGVMQTPVAILNDFFAGWCFPRNLYGWGWVCWRSVAYEPWDHLMHGILDLAYPSYTDSGFFHDETGFNCPTPYGDVFDCLLSDAPGWVLRQYPVVVLGGKLTPGDEIREKLETYVRQGGHLVTTEGNWRGVFGASGASLRTSPGEGRVTVIPSEWGVVENPVVKLPCNRVKEDVHAPKPFPLDAITEKTLDAVFRAQALFTTGESDGKDGLSLVTCRRAKGEYTLCVANNTWIEQPLRIRCPAGRLLSLEELPTSNREREAEGFLPPCIATNAPTLGVDSTATIAGGQVRLFRAKIDESAVHEIAVLEPPANPVGCTLKLRSCDSIKDQLLKRPTFFQNFDSVMVDWRYVCERDDEALSQESNWIRLQGLKIIVDLSPAINLYPDFRFTEDVPQEWVRSKLAFERLIRKCGLLGGVTDLIIAGHRIPGGTKEKKAAWNANFDANVKWFCREAAKKGITVRFMNNLWKPDEMHGTIARLGEPNLKGCASWTAIAYLNWQNVAAKVAAYECDFWLLGAPLKQTIGDSHFFQYFRTFETTDCPSLDAVLKAIKAKGAHVVFDADYADIDAEYRDVRRYRTLK